MLRTFRNVRFFIFTLAFPVLLYTVVNWIGVQEPVAKLARPVAASLAERAGLHGGEHVTRAGFGGELEPVDSFEDLRWRMTRGALDGRDLTLEIAGEGGRPARELVLPLSRIEAKDADAQMFRKIGLITPLTRPEIGEVMPQSAAERS